MSTIRGELESTREELTAANEQAKQEVKSLHEKLEATEIKLATTLAEKQDEKVSKSEQCTMKGL